MAKERQLCGNRNGLPCRFVEKSFPGWCTMHLPIIRWTFSLRMGKRSKKESILFCQKGKSTKTGDENWMRRREKTAEKSWFVVALPTMVLNRLDRTRPRNQVCFRTYMNLKLNQNKLSGSIPDQQWFAFESERLDLCGRTV
mmetsp:Transcript_688/g.1599  ORF Transcript_688/g.1599 Transcript_688/m.1599 type:complete len:141 (+) Transcript_688:553-975(+)